MRILAGLFLVLVLVTQVFAEYQWVSPSNDLQSPPEIKILEKDISGFTVEISLAGLLIEEISTHQGTLHRLRLADSVEPSTMLIGAPELPQIARLIEIPSTASASVTVISTESVVFPNMKVYPYQTPSTDETASSVFDYDENAYLSSLSFPQVAASVENIGVWRDLQVGTLRISPVVYSSAKNEVRLYTKLTIRVDFTAGILPAFPKPAVSMSPVFEKMYKGQVLNYTPGEYRPELTDEPVGIKYLVIAESRALDYIEPLVDLRNAQGYKTQVIVPDTVINTPEEIKAYINSLYLSDGLEYVLMVGDPYINSGPVDVPMYYWDYDPNNQTYSDSWYTCLVPGNDGDIYPEIAIGRLVYDNTTELDRIVGKTMNYLTGCDTSVDWFQKSLLAAHQEEYPLKYTQCKEQIRTYDYDIQDPQFTTIYGGAGGNNTAIINYINNGSCGLFNYRGHGTENSWPVWSSGGSFMASSVNQFTNQNRLFILFDVCCLNNNVVTYNGTCLAESFMKANYGAAAVHAAIVPSYTDPNHIFDKEFYKAIYDQGINNIGYASNYASVQTNSQFGSIGAANFRMYFWQGDPAIDLWTHIPAQPTVNIFDPLLIGTYNLNLSVEAGGSPAEGAMVCLQNDEIYAVGFTDENGICSLQISPPPFQNGEAYLTVSGHNIAFHTDTLDIGGGFAELNGTVASNQTAEPLSGALILLPEFGLADTADVNGQYSFQVPSDVRFTAEASYPGYITHIEDSLQLEITQVENLYIPLFHAELNPSLPEIIAWVDTGTTGSTVFTISNDGDYLLEYSAVITGENAGPTMAQLVYFNGTSLTGDNGLSGMTFDGETIWVAGAADASTNLLYKFTPEGTYIGSIPQPNTTTANGFAGLCWDGQNLYGCENSSLIKFDRDGNYISTITTNMSNIKGIAYKPDNGHLFIAMGTFDIREIDTLGNTIGTYNHDLNISGLYWYEGDSAGFNLYIYSTEPALTISKMRISDGEVQFVGQILGMPDNTSGGCFVSDTIDPLHLLFFGLVQGSTGDKIKGWQLARLFNHFTLEPAASTVPPQSALDLTLSYDASQLEADIYDAILRFTHNGIGYTIDMPVTLYVAVSGVESSPQAGIPSEFTVFAGYPNPFNAETVVKFALPLKAEVTMSVYDILGRETLKLDLGTLEAGYYSQKIDGKKMSSGVYFCRVNACEKSSTVKLILIK